MTLYAGWEASTTANYTIVIARQKASDPVDSDPSNNTYEFAESFLLSGTIGQSVSAGSNYTGLNTDSYYNALHPGANVSGQSNPYYGYSYNAANSDADVTVKADGSAVLYVRYDWNTRPDMSGRTFTLTFADSVETEHAGDAIRDGGQHFHFSGIPAGREHGILRRDCMRRQQRGQDVVGDRREGDGIPDFHD